MIIDEIVGDMLRTDCQTITIPVNMVGTMGNGLALYCKKRWPITNTVYLEACRNKSIRTRLHVVPVGEKQILLLPTKNHWMEDSNEWLVRHSLQLLVNDYKSLEITSLAMPKIGCGKGNMDYNEEIRSLLFEYLNPIDIPVKIYI